MSTTPPSVTNWLRSAIEDAERRGLSGAKPLLEGLAQSLTALRAADAEYAAERRQPVDADDRS